MEHVSDFLALLEEPHSSLDYNHIRKEARRLRTLILETRLFFELFAPAYSHQDKESPWYMVWTNLREGYSLIGKFKDIPKNNRREQSRSLRPLRDWARRQVGSQQQKNIERLMSASLDRPQKSLELQKTHWDTSLLKLKPKRSARFNFNRLARAILRKLSDESETLFQHKKLNNLEDADKIHEFRKQLRIALKLLAMTETQNRSRPYRQLGALNIALGKLNDRVEQLRATSAPAPLAKRRSPRTPQLRRRMKHINESWTSIKRRHNSSDTQNQIESLVTLIEQSPKKVL